MSGELGKNSPCSKKNGEDQGLYERMERQHWFTVAAQKKWVEEVSEVFEAAANFNQKLI